MRRPVASAKLMAAAGWTRTDSSSDKCGARWSHVAGWKLTHCGHPTAHFPWILEDRAGRMILTGCRRGAGVRSDVRHLLA